MPRTCNQHCEGSQSCFDGREVHRKTITEGTYQLLAATEVPVIENHAAIGT